MKMRVLLAFAAISLACAVLASAADDEKAKAEAEAARKRYEQMILGACKNMDGNINNAEAQKEAIIAVANSIVEVSPVVKDAWAAMDRVDTELNTANGAVNAASQFIHPEANLNNAQFLVQDSRINMAVVAGMLSMNVKDLFGFAPPANWNGSFPGETPSGGLDPAGVTPPPGTGPGTGGGGGTGGESGGWGAGMGGGAGGGILGGSGVGAGAPLTGGSGVAGGPAQSGGGGFAGGSAASTASGAEGPLPHGGESTLVRSPSAAVGSLSGRHGSSAREGLLKGGAGYEDSRRFSGASGAGAPGAHGSDETAKGGAVSWQAEEAWKLNLKGDHRAAERAARAAILADPNDSDAYEALAWAELRQSRYKEAEKDATYAILLNRLSARAYRIRAFARQMLGDRKGMLADIEMAARLNPDYAEEAEIARRGGDIYDPSKGDDELWGPRRGRGGPWKGIFAGILALAAVAGAFFMSRRRRPSGGKAKASNAPSVIGDYVVGNRLGGSPSVFEAKDRALQRPVVVRRLCLPDAGERSGMLYALRKAARLKHPALVAIYEVVENGEWVSLISERVEGETVRDLSARGGIGLERIVGILGAVGRALEAAHAEGLSHGKLHLGNVFVTGGSEVRVADLGTAGPGTEPAQDLRALGRCLSEWAVAAKTVLPSELRDLAARAERGEIKDAAGFVRLLKG